ncbi:unnamed protein product [Rotaria sordida]|uniref:DUF2383 domain-containing protein n=1 Tax=Rotaria sordida TaxID=392033 RepID=A0A815K0K8_9BILA|nr:unnamed protein product [Rotaria sordida]
MLVEETLQAKEIQRVPKVRRKSKFVAASRLKFIDQLSSVLRSDFGIEPVTSGSNLETAHHIWMDFKKCLVSDGLDEAEILAEVHRSEAHLIEHYIAALSEPEHITDKVWRVLQEQLKAIKERDASLYSL